MNSISVCGMKELDRKTIEDFGVPSLCLMENAGRIAAEVVLSSLRERMKPENNTTEVSVFCGTGNNGGDGFVAARYLKRQGLRVEIYIVGEESGIKGDAGINFKAAKNVGIEIKEARDSSELRSDMMLDAIFGVGLKGEMKGRAKTVINMINENTAPVISVDVPSGLDADTGEVACVAVKAEKTVTMHCAKKGFFLGKGPEYTGEIVVADIGLIG